MLEPLNLGGNAFLLLTYNFESLSAMTELG